MNSIPSHKVSLLTRSTIFIFLCTQLMGCDAFVRYKSHVSLARSILLDDLTRLDPVEVLRSPEKFRVEDASALSIGISDISVAVVPSIIIEFTAVNHSELDYRLDLSRSKLLVRGTMPFMRWSKADLKLREIRMESSDIVVPAGSEAEFIFYARGHDARPYAFLAVFQQTGSDECVAFVVTVDRPVRN